MTITRYAKEEKIVREELNSGLGCLSDIQAVTGIDLGIVGYILNALYQNNEIKKNPQMRTEECFWQFKE